ncbi:hypothetical protein BGZ76_000988 [Entomortierella beljakovae]|nr:hypothetical protein BGZ76_000988 [Entomortierella beljakovae]
MIKSGNEVDTAISHIDAVSFKLEKLEEITIEGTKSLVALQRSGAQEIQESMKILASDLSTKFDTLETSSLVAWSAMLDDIQAKGGKFQKELSLVLDDATADMQKLASTSQDRLSHLNQLIGEFEAKQT